MSMKVTGKTIKQMVSESSIMSMVANMRDIGRVTFKTVKVQRPTLTDLNTQGLTKLDRNMAKATIRGMMVLIIMVSGRRIKCKGLESIIGLTAGSMMDSGRMTKCTARVFTHGKMDGSMKDHISMTIKKGLVYILGMMVVSLKATGSLARCMEKEYIGKRMDKNVKVLGNKASA